jgi:hypothetical protein
MRWKRIPDAKQTGVAQASLWLAGRVLLVFALLAARALPADESEAQQPMPQPGDELDFPGGILTVKCERWRVTDIDRDGYLVSRCGDYELLRADNANFNPVKVTDGKGRTVISFDPFYPELSFPLFKGKQWTGHYVGYSAAAIVPWDANISCQVTDYFSAPKPAFRIECEEHWHVALIGGTTHTVRWYSPVYGAVVRVVNREHPEWNQRLQGWPD